LTSLFVTCLIWVQFLTLMDGVSCGRRAYGRLLDAL